MGEIDPRQREDAWPELVLTISAHRLRAARVEPLARVEYRLALCRAAAGERANETGPEMHGEHRFALAKARVQRALRIGAVISVIRHRERGRMLQLGARSVSTRRRQRLIGAIHLSLRHERRQTLMRPQSADGRRVAHAEVDTEIRSTRFDPCHLEAIREARRRAYAQRARVREISAVRAVDDHGRQCVPLRKGADGERVARTLEPCGLPQLDARLPRGLEERSGVSRDGRIGIHAMKEAPSVEPLCAEIAHAKGEVEPARAAEEVVVRVARGRLHEVHGVEAHADLRLVQGRLAQHHAHRLHAVEGRRHLEHRELEQVRLVEVPLALEHRAPAEEIPGAEAERVHHRARRDLIRAVDHDLAHRRDMIRNDMQPHASRVRDGINRGGRIDQRIRVPEVPQGVLKLDAGGIQLEQIERPSTLDERQLFGLLRGDEQRVVGDGDIRDHRGLPFADVEADHDLSIADPRDRRVHLRLTKALAVVEHANAQDVALELLPIQVVPLLEPAIAREPAEGDEDDRAAARGLGVDARLQLPDVDGIAHAGELHVPHFRRGRDVVEGKLGARDGRRSKGAHHQGERPSPCSAKTRHGEPSHSKENASGYDSRSVGR